MQLNHWASPDTLKWRLLLESHFHDRPFNSSAAAALGISSTRLARLLSTGLIVRGLRDTYRLEESPSRTLMRAQDAVQAIPDAVVARRTSAWRLGQDLRTPAEAATEIPIECLVKRGRTPSRIKGIRCYQADLEDADIIESDGARWTRPTRTAADLLRWAPPHMALAAVDQMARGGMVSAAEILEALTRWPGERNVRRARALTSILEPLSESYGESWLRLRILEAGFPAPEAQIPMMDDSGRQIYRLDLGWRRLRLAIEYDGEEFHTGEHLAAADAARREDLAKRFGWRVIGVGRAEVLGTSLALERGIGELLGLEPRIRRRTW